MKKKANRPVAPFYAAAGMWGLYILLFPIRRPVDWLLLALLTGAVFLIARGLCGITRAPEKKQPWLQTTRGGAAVLAAVVLLTGGWTLLRQPAPLPDVSIGNWISDEADLLSEKTESEITLLNAGWNEAHNTVCAVAVVDSVEGWLPTEYAGTLGSRWGLGPNDLLLLLDRSASTADSPAWYLAYGDTLTNELTEPQLEPLRAAFTSGYSSGGWNLAVSELFRAMSETFPRLSFDTTDFYMLFLYNFYTDSGWTDYSAMRITPVLLTAASVFAVWAILDRRRYRSYQASCERGEAAPEDYHPVFWGRTH